jgi:hypothetical protein
MRQSSNITVESFAKLTQNGEGQIANAPLNATDIRAVDLGVVGKFFLGPPQRGSSLS